MDRAIDFHYEFRLGAIEIEDESFVGMLPSKSPTV
jgi:hypothetical protein